MLGSEVVLQSALDGGAVGTEVALEGALSRMGAHVAVHLCAARAPLAAVQTRHSGRPPRRAR